MVNPIKFLGRATGISNLLDKGENTPAGAAAASPPATAAVAPPPAPAPIVGQAPTQAPPQAKPLTPVTPSIIGNAGGLNQGQQPTGYVTLLGQAK